MTSAVSQPPLPAASLHRMLLLPCLINSALQATTPTLVFYTSADPALVALQLEARLLQLTERAASIALAALPRTRRLCRYRFLNHPFPFQWAGPFACLVGRRMDLKRGGRLHRPLLRLRRCFAFYVEKHLSRPSTSSNTSGGQGRARNRARRSKGMSSIATNTEAGTVAVVRCCT